MATLRYKLVVIKKGETSFERLEAVIQEHNKGVNPIYELSPTITVGHQTASTRRPCRGLAFILDEAIDFEPRESQGFRQKVAESVNQLASAMRVSLSTEVLVDSWSHISW